MFAIVLMNVYNLNTPQLMLVCYLRKSISATSGVDFVGNICVGELQYKDIFATTDEKFTNADDFFANTHENFTNTDDIFANTDDIFATTDDI